MGITFPDDLSIQFVTYYEDHYATCGREYRSGKWGKVVCWGSGNGFWHLRQMHNGRREVLD
jgi:hypothetical protein